MISCDDDRIASRCMSCMTRVSWRYMQNESPIQRRCFLMQSGLFPASSKSTHAQTGKEQRNTCSGSQCQCQGVFFYRLSDKGGNSICGYVHQRCFLCAITANGILSGCFNLLALRIILAAHLTGHRIGQFCLAIE